MVSWTFSRASLRSESWSSISIAKSNSAGARAFHAVVDDVHRQIVQLEDVVADFRGIVVCPIVQVAAHFVEFVDRMNERERVESVLERFQFFVGNLRHLRPPGP